MRFVWSSPAVFAFSPSQPNDTHSKQPLMYVCINEL